jgi:hypothetical protein
VISAAAFQHHPHAARLLITYARASCDLTWASLMESADRVEVCEAIAAEIREREECHWQAELLDAIEAEEAYDD